MIPSPTIPEPSGHSLRSRKRIPWFIYGIASLGLLINLVYYGAELVKEPAGFTAHFGNDLVGHAIVISLMFTFPILALFIHRSILSSRLLDYSRELEAEVRAHTTEIRGLQEFYRSVLASANDLIYVVGPDKRFKFVSGDSRKTMGIDSATLIGELYTRSIPPQSVPLAVMNFNRVMQGEEVPPAEMEALDESGEYRCVEVSSAPLREDGRVVAEVGVIRDITERKKLERRINERNRELAQFTHRISSLIGIAEKERSFSVRYDNPGLVRCREAKECSQTECPAYDAQDRRCWQIAGTYCGGEVQGVFAQKLERCDQCEVFKASRPDKLTALGEDFNNMMAMLQHEADQQRQLEKQLVQSAKLAAVGELAANVAHEINNPLTGVLGHASLLRKSLPPDDPMVRSLTVIERETLRAREIVRGLLDFARQDNVSRRRVAAEEIIGETLELLDKTLRLANVETVLDYDEGNHEVFVDVNQMKQVFINLVNNAVQAMPGGGRLTVAVRSSMAEGRLPRVEVAFSDTGVGIPSDKLRRVFDPFYTSKEAGKGTGLGLSVSRKIVVDQHDGAIGLKSEEGSGTTFTIRLPVASISIGYQDVA